MDILDVKFESCDFSDPLTIREWLGRLLVCLWDEGESFNGKRPFGNSGWQFDPVAALIKEGFIEGDIDDEYGDVEWYDEDSFDRLIRDAIISLMHT